MPQLDRGAAEHGAVRAILEAHDRGYKTILTMKFPYHRGDFPKAGTPAFERDLARVDAVLPLVVGQVDILVVGNEPYPDGRAKARHLDPNNFSDRQSGVEGKK